MFYLVFRRAGLTGVICVFFLQGTDKAPGVASLSLMFEYLTHVYGSTAMYPAYNVVVFSGCSWCRRS